MENVGASSSIQIVSGAEGQVSRVSGVNNTANGVVTSVASDAFGAAQAGDLIRTCSERFDSKNKKLKENHELRRSMTWQLFGRVHTVKFLEISAHSLWTGKSGNAVF